jgi:hypothetical protein
LLIRTEIDLLTLARPQRPLHPLHKPAALFDIPQLSAAENAAWTQRFEDLRQQCGCRAGIVGLSVFTLSSFAFILVAALQTTPGSPPDYQVVLVNGAMFFVGLILSALLGKLTGLIIAALALSPDLPRSPGSPQGR